jgi:catechol 2,3-dioxygenase-like lactoylglutathione lyase family enzyme
LVRGRTITVVTRVVPFLRVADAEASAEWYGRLGFSTTWHTRAEPHLPLFVAISNGDAMIFLSEHTGDAHPDGLIYLYVDDVEAVAADFGTSADLAYYGMREIELTDPDGNRLRIGTPAAG